MSEEFPRAFNGDYELLGLLGKGGMGSHVYKARQIKLDRIVALKVLDIMGDNEEAEKRFYSEAQAMKELNHQNLATVFDYGKQDGKIFIAMTFVEGEALSDIIKKKKILPVKHAIYIAWNAAKGLEYAHERGVVHRDIKPSNIMIKKNSDPCIIDFGISLTMESLRLTEAGMTMGTPEYMSPEQCHNKNVTLQSDIYNLGIVFYEMLTGNPPFTGGASLAILNKQIRENPASITKINPEVSPALENIIFKCLEKKCENRYSNFYEFIKDLSALNSTSAEANQETSKNDFIGRLSKTERVVFYALGIFIPLLLIFLIILLAFKSPSEKIPPAISNLNPASWVVQSVAPETPIAPVFDSDLGSAWVISKNTALKANNGILITIKFAKPTLVSHLGIAIGDQSSWDNFQKYGKPKDIWVRYTNSTVKEYKVNEQSSVKKISLEDKLGVQYISWTPAEVTELMFELKTVQNDSKSNEVAISEIRILGMEMK